MPDLTVRNVSQNVVDALKRRAAANGRSVEAEHQELQRVAPFAEDKDFLARARALRQWLRSSIDSAHTIQVTRDFAS